MTKDQLAQELKQKLKLGIKPSDLKKPRIKNSLDEGYESDSSVDIIPSKTPLKKDQIRQLQSQPIQLSKETEQAIMEANQKIRQLIKTNEDLQSKNKELSKSITNLQNQTKNKAETKSEETQPKTLSKTAKSKPQLTNFSCPTCRVKTQTPI